MKKPAQLSTKKQYLFIALAALVFCLVTVYLYYHKGWFSPDQFFVLGLVMMFLFGRAKAFIIDWSPPIAYLMGYEYFRGLASRINSTPHIYPMIKVDEKIFGELPTLKLQSLFYSPGVIHFYDYIAAILYMSHFFVPLVVGMILWLKNRYLFKKYFNTLILVSYLSFITYVLFPAMPPWLASESGYIPHVNRVLDHTMSVFGSQLNMPTLYRFVGVNLVAAMPSLHAAFPTILLLILFKRAGIFLKLLLISYAAGIYFTVIYLGEHYAIDVFAGILYALASYYIFKKRAKLHELSKLSLKKIYAGMILGKTAFASFLRNTEQKD